MKAICELRRLTLKQLRVIMQNALDYDNAFGYTIQKKSKIVENFLLGFPQGFNITVVKMQGGYLFLHGYQNVKALTDFIDNDFCLKSQTVFKSLNGKSYEKLPQDKKDFLNYIKLTVDVINGDLPQDMLDLLHDRLIY